MKPSDNHSEDYFNRFDEAYEELLMNDTNEALAFLKEEGFDIDAARQRRKKEIKSFQFKLTAVQNKKRHELLIKKAHKKLHSFITKSKALAKEELTNLLHEKAPAYQFRNLDSLNEDGIRELLNEVDLIKLIEELDNSNKT